MEKRPAKRDPIPVKQVQCPKTEDCDAWIKENYPNHEQENKMPTPDFHFTTADAKWGDGHGRVEATVLKFWCVEKDGIYLKSLMLHAWASTNL
eukprot:3999832-Ditylum_brightwellii.AAC.1